MDKETGMGLALSLIDEDASAAGFAGATTAATMMAIVHRRYGCPDVLEHTEVDKPVVGDDDVLVRVHAAAVHPGDYFIMTGVPTVVRLAFGLRRPRNGIRGMDVAGRVEAVGRSVQGLEPGDAVFGRSSTGTLAEYTRAPADNFAPKPVNLSMEQAAAIPCPPSPPYRRCAKLPECSQGRRS
jgi:NADPH:quinone reductase-like Zn-dependent oxidoreductase